MNIGYQEILSFARDRLKDATQLKKALSIALGIALSRKCQLPSSEVDDGASHYVEMVAAQVCHEAAFFNENLIVDIDLVNETARAFWLIRYYNAYPLKLVSLYSEDDGHFMNKMSGVGHLISPTTFALCQENAACMVSMVNKIRALEIDPITGTSA